MMRFMRKILMMIVLLQGVSQCSQDKWTPPEIPENIKNLEKFLKDSYVKKDEKKDDPYSNIREFYLRYYDRIIRSIEKNQVFVDYTFDLAPPFEAIKKGTFFCNFFKRHFEPFFNKIIIPQDDQVKKDFLSFLSNIAALTQDSPKCWMTLLNKVENMIKSLPTKQAQGRLERLRAYLSDFFRKKVERV